jgi:DNA adenine methylase
MVSPPLRWYGGKYYLAGKIAAVIARVPHQTYVEVYGGAASVLLNKAPSPIDVWNDIDSRLVNFFRVLRHAESRERLLEALAFTPFARAEFAACCREPTDSDPVEAARRFFVLCQQSVSSGGAKERMTPGSWAKSVGVSRRGMSQNASRWWGNIENLPAIADRFARVQIECMGAMKLLSQYDRPETLFYLDPPYVAGSRVAGQQQVYKHEMTDEQHIEMIGRVGSLKGPAILSGYDNEVYRGRMGGWGRIGIPSKARSSTAGSTRGRSAPPPDRMEILWLNPRAMEIVKKGRTSPITSP